MACLLVCEVWALPSLKEIRFFYPPKKFTQSVLSKGRPFEKIIETAKEEQVGLVAMGSHGRTGFARLFMGSVTERVIGTVGCPVLVVKKRQAEEPKEK